MRKNRWFVFISLQQSMQRHEVKVGTANFDIMSMTLHDSVTSFIAAPSISNFTCNKLLNWGKKDKLLLLNFSKWKSKSFGLCTLYKNILIQKIGEREVGWKKKLYYFPHIFLYNIIQFSNCTIILACCAVRTVIC